jgi:hypothetical protein
MYYHGVDAQTRRAIERGQQERAKAITAFWASLFSFGSTASAPARRTAKA